MANASEPLLSVRDLVVEGATSTGRKTVVEGVAFEVAETKFGEADKNGAFGDGEAASQRRKLVGRLEVASDRRS